MSGNTGVSIKLNLKNIPEQVASEVIQRIMEKTATYAKDLVTVDTGNLRGSITAVYKDKSGEIYSEADYALDQEYGDPKKPNYGFKPYMRPAASIAGSQKEIDKATVAAMARYNK